MGRRKRGERRHRLPGRSFEDRRDDGRWYAIDRGDDYGR
jgi:hypothetical protein